MIRWVSILREPCLLSLLCLAFILLGAASGCAQRAGNLHAEENPLSSDSLTRKWRDLSLKPIDDRAGPLTLERAVSEALTASPELEQIRQRIEAAGEQVRKAEAAFYPRLVLAEEFNTTDNPVYALMHIINQRRLPPTVDFNNPGRQQNVATRVQGEWSLFEGGSRWHDRKAMVAQRDAVGAELLAARNQLVSRVTETYYRWLQALGYIAVAERALEAAKTDERLGEARYQAEMALPSEVMRLKSRTAEVHGNLVTARSSARRLEAGLERLLARPIRLEEIPDPALVAPATTEGEGMQDTTDLLVRRALDRRPEMAAVRSLIQAARERVGSAWGGLLPKVRTSAQYERDSEEFSDSAESWMVGVQATWALFEGGITLAEIREARSRLKELEARGEAVALEIALEVHQATLTVQEAAEKIRVAEERKKWALKALEEVRELYRNQVVTVDSLLQAEVSWNQAEVAHTAALFEGKIAQVLLRQSLGDFASWMESQNG